MLEAALSSPLLATCFEGEGEGLTQLSSSVGYDLSPASTSDCSYKRTASRPRWRNEQDKSWAEVTQNKSWCWPARSRIRAAQNMVAELRFLLPPQGSEHCAATGMRRRLLPEAIDKKPVNSVLSSPTLVNAIIGQLHRSLFPSTVDPDTDRVDNASTTPPSPVLPFCVVMIV